jgi:anti-sigma regulatory factor (Ser/Thr protein kinase)
MGTDVAIDPALRIFNSFAPDPDAAVRAAQTVDAFASHLGGEALGDEAIETLRWIVFELVSNSLSYSHATPEQSIDVAVELGAKTMRVEVRDPGSFDRCAPPQNPHGWGLHVIERLADRWDVLSSPAGPTIVWVEIDLRPKNGRVPPQDRTVDL